jgi:alkylation response protein AidB-like acyl-CoA dehydrogenase
MDFDLAEEDRALQERITDLFDPDTLERISQMGAGDTEKTRQTVLYCLKRLSEIGYLELGLNDGKRNSVSIASAGEALARISPSLHMNVELSARLYGRLVAIYGTSDQQEKILPGIKGGRVIASVAIPVEEIETKTDGEMISLSGTIEQVINGPISDRIAISVRHQNDKVFYLLSRGHEGLSLGEPFHTLGFRGAPSSAIFLHDAPVAGNKILGPFRVDEAIQDLLVWEDQVMTTASLGIMHRSFHAALDYAKNHKKDGKPLIAHQEMGFKLAEMLTLMQTSQLFAYRAAWMYETGHREADVLAHCAKVFCSESAEEVSSQALQILGKQGYSLGESAEEGYLDAKYLQIAGTPSEIARNRIGDELLA